MVQFFGYNRNNTDVSRPQVLVVSCEQSVNLVSQIRYILNIMRKYGIISATYGR